jgi:hypothetical protein
MELGIIEVVVNRKRNSLLGIVKVICIALAVIMLFSGVTLMGTIGFWAFIPLALGVGAGVGAWFAGMNCCIDYEYSLVDKELRVAKIMNKERRKAIATYDLEKMEILAPVNSHELDSYRNRQNDKESDYSTHDESRKATTYLCYLEGNQKLILDIDGADGEKLLKAIRMLAPRKVFQA